MWKCAAAAASAGYNMCDLSVMLAVHDAIVLLC